MDYLNFLFAQLLSRRQRYSVHSVAYFSTLNFALLSLPVMTFIFQIFSRNLSIVFLFVFLMLINGTWYALTLRKVKCPSTLDLWKHRYHVLRLNKYIGNIFVLSIMPMVALFVGIGIVIILSAILGE